MTMLDDIKVGDQVIVYGGICGARIESVTRVTKSRVMLGVDIYLRSTGRSIGGYTKHWIVPYSGTHKEEYERGFREEAMMQRCRKAKAGLNAIGVTATNIVAVEAFLDAIEHGRTIYATGAT